MKTIAFFVTCAFVSAAFAAPPTDRMVLEFIQHQNRMHSTKELDAFLVHIPEDGYIAIDASGDEEQKHLITREMIRENTVATWKRFDPSVWSSGLAIRRFVRTEEYVEIELSFTEVIPLEGRELLAHGILIQRVEEQNGRATLISQRLVEHRSKWISLAEQTDAPEAATTSSPVETSPARPR